MNRRQDRQVFAATGCGEEKKPAVTMASIEVPSGRIRRDELRAAIAACGTLAQQRDWRNSNGEIREHIESNPHVRNPKDIAKRFIGRNSAAVRAERIAKPFGGSGKDILREQAEFWLERKLPENPPVRTPGVARRSPTYGKRLVTNRASS